MHTRTRERPRLHAVFRSRRFLALVTDCAYNVRIYSIYLSDLFNWRPARRERTPRAQSGAACPSDPVRRSHYGAERRAGRAQPFDEIG